MGQGGGGGTRRGTGTQVLSALGRLRRRPAGLTSAVNRARRNQRRRPRPAARVR